MTTGSLLLKFMSQHRRVFGFGGPQGAGSCLSRSSGDMPGLSNQYRCSRGNSEAVRRAS